MHCTLSFKIILRGLLCLILFFLPLTLAIKPLNLESGSIDKHQPGVCATYGTCGKKSFFGAELPCPATVPAKSLNENERNLLVNICGDNWSETDVCCTGDQLKILQTSLKKADSLISSCPACHNNFYQFWCQFTCSPNQSEFVDVTSTSKSTSNKEIVSELNYYVDPQFAEDFYDSCKEIKFSATNGFAMDLIGGGAKDYKSFLKFLGDEKPMLGGSPFQINFPWDEELPENMTQFTTSLKKCSDGDPRYRCACSDCSDSCPNLPEVSLSGECHIGILPCFSFAMLIIYAVILLGAVVGYCGMSLWREHIKGQQERRRLLFNTVESEDYDSADSYLTEDRFGYRQFASFGSTTTTKAFPLNNHIQNGFAKVAYKCARYPAITISIMLAVITALSLGLLNFSLETNPVKLWVSPSSESYQQKLYFDQNFGPFYRSEQIYLVNDTGSIMEYENIKWWFKVEERIRNLHSSAGITLQDTCFKPTGDACVIQSFTQYFGGEIGSLPEKSWKEKIVSCASSPVNCLPSFQLPLKKEMIFGGFRDNDILTSRALISTFVLNNGEENSAEFKEGSDWEKNLEELLLNIRSEASEKGLRLSFNTEISLEKELNKSSNTDIRIIIISYIVMFTYASLALGGRFPSFSKNSAIKSKFSLGLTGIVIVLFSVTASLGFFSMLGVKATLIIAEVIPFLILALGVDNIFLLSHELENVNRNFPNDSVEERVSRAVGKVGPSILLSSTCQILTFTLGATVAMPAVRNFAIYSAGSVFFNFILQLTIFVAALALDQRRMEDNRVDIFPWIKLDGTISLDGEVFPYSGTLNISDESIFSEFMRKYYAPSIMRPKVKKVILFIFFTWLAISVALLPKVQLGLDQKLAVPKESYLVDYFNDLYDYFGSGPPVYFVVNEVDVTTRKGQQTLCGKFSTCDEFSLNNIIQQESKRPKISYLSESSASWIDDFFQWLNPNLDECCRFKKGTNETEMCSPNANPRSCDVCYENKDPQWNIHMDGLPENEEFMKYFNFWINAPSEPCPLGGKAPYSNAIALNEAGTEIVTSSFRASHTPLRSQDDFINAYDAAQRISRSIEEATGITVFPYSPFYIYFAQYGSIVQQTLILLLSAIILITILSTILLNSPKTSLIVSLSVSMIICNLVGVMALWGISLNAVSLVNLVISVGIAVEFCIHIARAFTVCNQLSLHENVDLSKEGRAFKSLVGVGGSVFGGIGLTKLIGVCVLAFTSSKIFEVYYFRMWISLVVISSLHSLVFLPIALSLWGGKAYLSNDSDEGLAGNLAARLHSSRLYDTTDEEDED
ncbi:patched sphingolipid transporter [Nadsonia fulvescens var. elongata DSM 6958]|uniref:Patched sphingolipid transporter n=1 Tax=Nadsonia fulvescens var. elongata DSM 6958 TaxID=857566 RepID=A0A1E3PLV4_9ASCO|nr:patched sphingolipid transporter [Nadsonia fulvescens var. elongata DSM 6958]